MLKRIWAIFELSAGIPSSPSRTLFESAERSFLGEAGSGFIRDASLGADGPDVPLPSAEALPATDLPLAAISFFSLALLSTQSSHSSSSLGTTRSFPIFNIRASFSVLPFERLPDLNRLVGRGVSISKMPRAGEEEVRVLLLEPDAEAGEEERGASRARELLEYWAEGSGIGLYVIGIIVAESSRTCLAGRDDLVF